MKALVFTRGFKTRVERLSNGLLIQLNADKNTLEQNRGQIKDILQKEGYLTHLNFLVACASSVFIDIKGDKEQRVPGSPHIASGFFNSDLKLIEGAYQSKVMRLGKEKRDCFYNGYKLVNQDFRWKSYYQTLTSTEKNFFELANQISISNSIYSNGKSENPLINAGGFIVLVVMKNHLSLEGFIKHVEEYKEKHDEYDRMKDNCAHAVLNSLEIKAPDTYGLSTQSALSLIIKQYKIGYPVHLADCLKDPFEQGFTESLRLQKIYKALQILDEEARTRFFVSAKEHLRI